MAMKWSGASTTIGSVVAATTVRVIADGAGVVCAAPGADSAIAPSNRSALVMDCMTASQFKGSENHHTPFRRLLEWPADLSRYWPDTTGVFGTATRRPPAEVTGSVINLALDAGQTVGENLVGSVSECNLARTAGLGANRTFSLASAS